MANPTESNTVTCSALGAPGSLLGEHLPELGDREVVAALLDLSLDAGLRGVLDEHRAAVEDRGIEFGLAGAVTADRVQVHAGPNEFVGDDRGACLVGCAGGDDVSAVERLGDTAGHFDREAERQQVAGEFGDRVGVDVEDAQAVDAEGGAEGERLEFRLAAGADHRHHLGVGTCERAGRERRRRGGAQRSEDRHLGEERRVAVVHFGEHTEGGHRLVAACRVRRMSVHVLEPVGLVVARGHQLDDPERRVARDPG